MTAGRGRPASESEVDSELIQEEEAKCRTKPW